MNAIVRPTIDFHSHYIHPSFDLTTAKGLSGRAGAHWQAINRLIADEKALLESVESGDLAARVVNSPTAFIADADGNVDKDVYRQFNDALAELVAQHPGKIHGLATVDTFGGDTAAYELERAVKDLGLRGVFLESARGDLLLDAPSARPVLSAAARLGVPVFAHPVNPQPLTNQLSHYGRLGTLLARGTINAATLVALIESETLEELPDLKVVVTALAIGGILLSSTFGDHSKVVADVAATLRRNIYVDTMGFNPALIRSAVDVLGVDNVLAGSDWPILNTESINAKADAAFALAGLDETAREKISSQNALKLLGLSVGGA